MLYNMYVFYIYEDNQGKFCIHYQEGWSFICEMKNKGIKNNNKKQR